MNVADSGDPLGLGGAWDWDKIAEMLRRQAAVKEVRAYLDQVHNSRGKQENLGELNDGEILNWLRT